ncbi:hypothetical protein ACQPZX_16155 [Actinoplanes sp. CA-142083]|uniref:hypothetical protein n=1 Tax=Actinoplanes sp. CA-142083 TaxID=3239903 RepID=UPI003D91B1C8
MVREHEDLPPKGPVPVADAWRAGVLLHARGEFDAAARVYARARDDDATEAADRAQLLAARASLSWAQGGDDVRRLAELAVAEALKSQDDAAQAAAYVAQALGAYRAGDRAANEHAYALALAAAERAGDVRQQVRIRSNVGSRLLEEGRYRTAIAELDAAIRLSEDGGMPEFLALARHNRAEAWLGLGELRRARDDADASLSGWQRMGSPQAAFGLLTIARVHRQLGLASQAVAAYREAIVLAEPTANAQVLTEAWAGLARSVFADDPAEAGRAAKQALDQSPTGGAVVPELAAGWVSLCSDDRPAAAGHAARAKAEAGRRRDAAGLAEALELGALADERSVAGRLSDLAEAAAIWGEVGNGLAAAMNAVVRGRLTGDWPAEAVARTRLHALGVRDGVWQIAGPLAALGAPPTAEVAVRALGEFAVLLSGEAVPTAAWQSRKARDLVKLLAARSGGPISRQTLAEALWPEAEAAVAGRRLAVLVSTVRGVFDPRHARPAGHFLAADEDSVRLDTRHVALDTAAFAAAARAALAAPRDEARLEAVATLYTGELCVGDESARVTLADLHREVLRRLAIGAGPDAAAGWYRRIVAGERYDEAAHLGLIGALTAAGRHGEARRAYDEYAAAMREIDVAPATRESLNKS